jgi:hypothetical protein
MSEDVSTKFSKSDANKMDLILLTLHRLQEDLHLAKCQLKTAIRELGGKQEYLNDTYLRLHRNFNDINERLHGIELTQERQNSST